MSKSLASSFPARILTMLAIALTSMSVSAATVIWSGASGTDTNWSTSANWAGGVGPTSADDVKFFNLGTNITAGVPNNYVDPAFGGTIASLQFGQTNAPHTISISNGLTLNITGAGGLFVGTSADAQLATTNNAAIKGVGGATLSLNNAAARIVLNQGQNSLNQSRAILDLSGLDNFNANAFAIGIGSVHFQNAVAQRNSGILYLARTNIVTLALTDTLVNYSTLGSRTNAIEVAYIGAGNNAGVLSYIYLGQTNSIYADSLGIGRAKASASSAATLTFNSAFSTPSALFRGVGGANSRVTWWAIGDMADSASSAQQSIGTNDFSLGTVDALVDTMSLGRDCSPSHTATGNNIGVLTFAAGTMDVNNIFAGNQILGPSTSVSGNIGIINVNAAAKLIVNNTLTLGRTTLAFTPPSTGLSAWRTQGYLNVRNGGTAFINSLAVGVNSSNCVVTLSNATLVVSNGIASSAKGLTYFNVTNSTLRLFVNGITNIFCTNLISAGATNLISPDSVSVFASYPKQVTLIKYVNQLGLGVTNFGLVNVPASAPGAYLSNNIANSSLDLVLPYDPRPVITAQPAGYSGSPGDNVSFSTTIDANSATPLTYQWYLGATPLTNGVTGNGSTISGSTTATVSITSAQAADNGNYSVTITNAYGSTNSAAAVLTISAGNVGPGLTGPNNLTVIQGNNGTFSASASGNPAPALQWQRNGVDIAGETSSSYTVTNAQYPADDGAVFSLIATNVAGSVTNSATLTVIVTPTISVQPISLVVTSTQAASFSVTASGVPTPTYQWYFNNIPISNETNATLNLASATAANIGTYKVVMNNVAGSVTSSNATLTVNSTMSATAFSPANGATGICYDTPLAVTFSVAPNLGTTGTIKIYNVTNSATPVDTITISLGATQPRSFPGDAQSFTYQTIQITGNTAKIYPHFSLLTSNQTYYVTIDAAAFTDVTGAYFTGITATNVWQFATKVGGPLDATNPVVNADGSADFLTVQGAVNSLATGTNATQRVVSVRNGLYNEIVDIAGKHNVTLRGQSRAGVVIYFPNNANFQTANAGSTHARMSFKVNANDIVLDTLTISNSTPQGGSQAEALMTESNAKRCVVNNCEIDSRQDTILANGSSQSQVYFYKSLIKGNFDYAWGGGDLFFDQCEIRTIGGTGNANFSAARTDTSASQSASFPWQNPGGTYTANGMSFVNCTFTAESGVGPVTLAGSNGTSGNNVSWYGCDFATNYIAPSAGLFGGNYLFWQAVNTSNGVPVTYPALTTIGVTNNDPRLLAATNIPTWFYGWTPSIIPVIVTNPVSQTVTAGQPASFGVLATGIPAPTYQWQHEGTNLPSATSATLNIASATLNDAGSYAVIVTTLAGNVTSSPATLTVNPPPNTAPTFSGPITGTNFTINVGVNLAVSCAATDSDSPAQTLTYSLLSGPSGAAVDSGTGNFTWRPTVGQGDSTNAVVVVVTDNGIPNLSTTNNFTVTVNFLVVPTTGTASYSGGQFNVSISGQVGPDYALQSNTNLVGGTWITVATTNSPASMPVNLTDPNAGSQAVQFYRIVTGPPLP